MGVARGPSPAPAAEEPYSRRFQNQPSDRPLQRPSAEEGGLIPKRVAAALHLFVKFASPIGPGVFVAKAPPKRTRRGKKSPRQYGKPYPGKSASHAGGRRGLRRLGRRGWL